MNSVGFTESILQEDLTCGQEYWDETKTILKKTFAKPVIIFGAGSMGQTVLNIFNQINIPVLAVCDTYKKGQTMPTGE